MISREKFINRIRELGYSFKRQAQRVDIWRRATDKHYISMPRTKNLREDYVRSTLRQAGCSPEEIEQFISFCDC
jgi:hypothetical protein